MALPQIEEQRPPVRLVTRQHVTVIDDGVVEDVAATCGLTGAGLYMMLERRVNKEGEWVCSLSDLSTAFGVSVRHIRDTCKTLEDAGFIVREPVLGPRGMNIGIRFILPKHLRTYRAEPTPDATPEPTPEPSCERVFGVSNTQVVTSNGDTPQPPKSRSRKPAEESEEFVRFYDAYPRHQGRSDACRAWRAVDPDPAMVEVIMAGLERLLPEYRARPPDKVPLPATWLNGSRWRDEPTRSAAFNGNGFQRKPGTYSAAELAAMAQQGGANGQTRDDETALNPVFRLVQ